MGELIGEITIIGQKEKSFRIEIETSQRIDPPLYPFEEVHHCGPSCRVFDGGEITFRFINEERDLGLGTEVSFPIHLDMIFEGIGFETELIDDLAVYRHPSLEHHPLCFSSSG